MYSRRVSARLSSLQTQRGLTGHLQCTRVQRLTDLWRDDRGGLDDETVKLLKEFPNVVYISCNPETLATNLQEVPRDSPD